MIILNTLKKSKGTNKKKYIIIHHTGGGTFESNCMLLSSGGSDVSCHYVIGQKGEVAKIGQHEDILWHAGKGKIPNTNAEINFNTVSIGIEVVSDGNFFTKAQHDAVAALTKGIMMKEGIGIENVLRHKDISGYRGKWDIGDNFLGGKTFEQWKIIYLNTDMTEEQKKAIDALSALLSLSWYAFIGRPDIQARISDIKKELLRLKSE